MEDKQLRKWIDQTLDVVLALAQIPWSRSAQLSQMHKLSYIRIAE